MSQKTEEKMMFNKTKWLEEVRILEEHSRERKVELKKESRDFAKKYPDGNGGCEPWGPDSIPHDLRGTKEELTLLYSIRAHHRGRLHMTKRGDIHGSDKETWTLDKQERLVGPHIAEYLLPSQRDSV